MNGRAIRFFAVCLLLTAMSSCGDGTGSQTSSQRETGTQLKKEYNPELEIKRAAPPAQPGPLKREQAQTRTDPAPRGNIQAVQETTVYITRTGAKYHRAGCSYLSKSQTAITLQEAKQKGYGPCSRCKPPV